MSKLIQSVTLKVEGGSEANQEEALKEVKRVKTFLEGKGVGVRAFWAIEASWRLPSFEKCAELSVISVLFASRVRVPSGSWMAARPLASVLTPSPGCTVEPVLASA